MWFNDEGDNSGYTKVLDDSRIFDIQNIDEGKYIRIVSNNATIPTGRMNFETSDYTDSGYPQINSTPCTFDDCSSKYVSGNTYDGHKFKYHVTSEILPARTLTACTDLVELYFPYDGSSGNTITKIGDGAFADCTNLSAITFNNVREIGNGAFYNCKGLKQIDWDACTCTSNTGVSGISDSAFYGCESLEALCFDKIPKISRLDIGNNAFYNCKKVSSITFPSASTVSSITIGDYAFYGIAETAMLDPDVLVVNIPRNINEIGDNAFSANGQKAFYLNWGVYSWWDSSEQKTMYGLSGITSSTTIVLGKKPFGLSDEVSLYVSSDKVNKYKNFFTQEKDNLEVDYTSCVHST